jgi:cytidyltransferase-like protein
MSIHVAISGYFNPLHLGHIRYIHSATWLGDKLTVIVNNDNQVLLKSGKLFISENERCEIITALRGVDNVILSIDQDRSVSKTLEMVRPDIFANGGDALPANFLEKEICERLGIQAVFGVGGYTKIQSSSSLLAKVRT